MPATVIPGYYTPHPVSRPGRTPRPPPRPNIERMITAEALTKRYGDRTAVDDLSFTVSHRTRMTP
ncbi:hypothetical protein GCM10017771_47490 [Streptomyces capitiformicae]|uniref:Uncharacterized protein n=1 Tax=Streptomyces capitiformicae TaxID=2014920 RepID=A0A918YZZ6_9ACTN|nr:hypothetical protein GCM10017771_47490 [Streptomyces capitiformicae]